MIILGVDPGSIVTGFGVIEFRGQTMRRIESGVIRMKSTDLFASRLLRIHTVLSDVIRRRKPDQFCLETAFYGKNIQSTLKLGHVRGVALLSAVEHDIAIAEYSPREVKRSVTGNGAAAKQQVAFMVRTLLGIRAEFRHLDEADGLALAICHAMHANASKKSFSSWKDFLASHPERVRQ